jgi:hypothetical protein
VNETIMVRERLTRQALTHLLNGTKVYVTLWGARSLHAL